MKITISNKRLQTKPNKGLEIAKFFGKEGTSERIQFKTGNFSLSTFEKVIGDGYTISYQCVNDDCMNRKSGYIGTQYIIVDVDETDLTMNELLSSIQYKPTIIHTSFSNLTEEKNNKYCYHLIYCLNEVIEGEQNFNLAFDYFTNDYKEIVDKNARDCHRIAFTSNSTLPNYEYKCTNIIYNTKDIGLNKEDDLNTFWEKKSSLNISTTSNNISRELKISQDTNLKDSMHSNFFELDEVFFNNLNSLQRSAFIEKYAPEYIYITETYIPHDMYNDNGYADLRGFAYYQVPSAKYSWDSTENKAIIKKIKNGHRTTMLWLDAIAFMKIIPAITKEYLVWLLVKVVYEHYMNGDGQLSNYFIVKKAQEVWENIDKLSLNPVKKTLKLNMAYWRNKGISNPLEATKLALKDMREKDFGSVYDFSMTLESNLNSFKDYGIKTTKKTLIKWLDENNFAYITEKQQRDEMIIYYFNEDNKRSSRVIEKLCKNDNINVSYKTVQKVINDYKLSKCQSN